MRTSQTPRSVSIISPSYEQTGPVSQAKKGAVGSASNNRWCNNNKTHSIVCTPEVEMLTLSLRPFYIPREFPTVVIGCVYIPPSANTKAAAELVAKGASSMIAKYPEAPAFIVGDYNSC